MAIPAAAALGGRGRKMGAGGANFQAGKLTDEDSENEKRALLQRPLRKNHAKNKSLKSVTLDFHLQSMFNTPAYYPPTTHTFALSVFVNELNHEPACF